MKKYIPCVMLLFVSIGFTSCQHEKSLDPPPEGEVELQFNAVAGAAPLVTGTGNYTNASGEHYTVTAFKYYIHNITVSNAGGDFTRPDYYLIDAEDPASATIMIKLPASRYEQISFTLGVDSARNVSGAQEGALDPGKGMFWTWNTGYIMAKLEGNTPVSSQPNNRFQYHIGGFRQANSVIQHISLPLAANQPLTVKAGKTSTVSIDADIDKWFDGPHQISFASLPVIMGPGTPAKNISENYARMFSIVNVSNSQ